MSQPSARNAPVWVSAVLVLVAIALVVVAIIYFAKTANDLPSYFPGHQHGSSHHHVIGAAVLAIIALVPAWFTGGRTDPPS
ncbi:MAG: hypothetical protein JWR83_2787 [Aeromicrobium sp.]|nr:hypothetical protein [Aeromicrobium sp.]